MNIVAIECGLCAWKGGAADEKAARLAVDWHLETAHGIAPAVDCLALADALLNQWVSEDAARDAETDLAWLNTLTLEDAAFLMSLQILPT